jgi:hypothetical protein
MKRHYIFFTIFFLALSLFAIQTPAQKSKPIKHSARVLLIPLDDRPPCLQFPLMMGLIGDAEVVAPPRELLGRFTEFGKPERIMDWIRKQSLKTFDAAIISVDMLGYGGLVGSRVHGSVDETTALKRIYIASEMRRLAPRLPIYGSSVIMRLAPTADGKNEAYREKLARWAEISSEANKDEKLKAETERLEKEIPEAALRDYKEARKRNLAVNLKAIDFVKQNVFDYLILSQDDAKPRGVHIADRERLIAEIKNLKLEDRIAVQPGADEVSMLLLARALNKRFGYTPKIFPVYSSDTLKNKEMPFEDRPLSRTVSFHIAAVGGVEVNEAEKADLLFYVYVSRFEEGRAESFAEEIKKNFVITEGDIDSANRNAKNAIIADIDPKGDVQGADIKFTDELKRRNIFKWVSGYASWNTAGNTIGTALPHGVLFALMKNKFGFPFSKWRMTVNEFERRTKIMKRVAYAQTWFLLHRLLDDYVYHSLIRPDAIKFAKYKGWNVFRFSSSEETKAVEDFISPKVRNLVWQNLNLLSPLSHAFMQSLICEDVENFSFVLPWGRTFEADIDFDLSCKDSKSTER